MKDEAASALQLKFDPAQIEEFGSEEITHRKRVALKCDGLKTKVHNQSLSMKCKMHFVTKDIWYRGQQFIVALAFNSHCSSEINKSQ